MQLHSDSVINQMDERDRMRQRLELLTHKPGKCPIAGCDHLLFPTLLLVHFLHKHAKDPLIEMSELFQEQAMRLIFNPQSHAISSQPQCLALMLYGGEQGKPHSLPGKRFLNMPNAGLLHERKRLANHLPILFMACRSTWYALLPDKRLEQELVSVNSGNCGIYVFWLIAPITTTKFYYTMNIYDRYNNKVHSVERMVRNYTQTQNPSDFLPSEANYLLLRDSEMKELLQIRRAKKMVTNAEISIEIFIHEKKVTLDAEKELKTVDVTSKLETPAPETNTSQTVEHSKAKGEEVTMQPKQELQTQKQMKEKEEQKAQTELDPVKPKAKQKAEALAKVKAKARARKQEQSDHKPSLSHLEATLQAALEHTSQLRLPRPQAMEHSLLFTAEEPPIRLRK